MQVKPGKVIEIDQNLNVKKYFYWVYDNFFKDKKSVDSLEEKKKKSWKN